MKFLYTHQQSKETEARCSQEFFLDEEILIENAGLGCWNILLKEMQTDQTLAVLVGGGNNGADALALARHAYVEKQVCILLCTERFHTHSQKQLNRCRSIGIPTYKVTSKKGKQCLQSSQWIVDGLCGIGLKGPLKEAYQKIVKQVACSSAKVCSIDIPSGAWENFTPDNSIVQANCTIMTGTRHVLCYEPLLRSYCGKLLFSTAGFPNSSYSDSQVLLLESEDISSYVTIPREDSYKHKRGEVAIFAGSALMPGAAILCASAALKSLAGLVRIYSSTSIDVSLFPSLMYGQRDKYIHADVALLGPGWGTKEEQKQILDRVLKTSLPLVLDADALTILATCEDLQYPRDNMVLTPHPAEAARLLHVKTKEVLERPYHTASLLAKKFNALVLLKSHVPTLVSPDGKRMIADGMNASLAVAGSGDVLAGIIAGLIAAGHDINSAVIAGMLVHQQAGRYMREEIGFGSSKDLISFISKVFLLDIISRL